MARSKTVRLYQSVRASVTFDMDIRDIMRQYQEHVEKNVLRKVAYAGVVQVYGEMRNRAPVGPTGNLKSSIYHWHNARLSRKDRQIYETGPNKKKAPHWFIVEYVHVLANTGNKETGQWFKKRRNTPMMVPAKPYIRPAVMAKGRVALERAKEVARQLMKQFKPQ